MAVLTEVFILCFACFLQKTKVIWPSPYIEETVGSYPIIPLSAVQVLFVMYLNLSLLQDS